tara:strand:- start:432 stop:647 length:216 start_codon:yes stop_codon:yes gene_type:complete
LRLEHAERYSDPATGHPFLQRWTGSADLVAAQPAELRMLAEQFIRFGVAVAESAQQVFGLTTKAIDMGIVR